MEEEKKIPVVEQPEQPVEEEKFHEVVASPAHVQQKQELPEDVKRLIIIKPQPKPEPEQEAEEDSPRPTKRKKGEKKKKKPYVLTPARSLQIINMRKAKAAKDAARKAALAAAGMAPPTSAPKRKATGPLVRTETKPLRAFLKL